MTPLPQEKKILVVEDEPFMQELILEVIKDLGLPALALASGDEAFAFLKEKHQEIYLMITDVRMPGLMDGVDLANAVYEKWPHIRIVLSSGYASGQMLKLKKPTLFLAKPWSLDALQNAIVDAIDQLKER